MRACRGQDNRRAFTLVEAMMASVVLAICVMGVAGTLAASYQQTISMHEKTAAVALGRQLLEEVTAYPFSSIITKPANRPFYSVKQYDGYSDTSTALTTLGGSTVDATSTAVYTRSVTVQTAGPGYPLGLGDVSSPNTDFALVTVTVTTPKGETVQLQRCVSNYIFTR